MQGCCSCCSCTFRCRCFCCIAWCHLASSTGSLRCERSRIKLQATRRAPHIEPATCSRACWGCSRRCRHRRCCCSCNPYVRYTAPQGTCIKACSLLRHWGTCRPRQRVTTAPGPCLLHHVPLGDNGPVDRPPDAWAAICITAAIAAAPPWQFFTRTAAERSGGAAAGGSC
jgi:hypothetical protein